MKVWTLCRNVNGKRPWACFIFGHSMVDWNGHARCEWCELNDGIRDNEE